MALLEGLDTGSIAENLSNAVKSIVNQYMNTAIIGKITEVIDPSARKVNVQPIISRKYGNQTINYSKILNAHLLRSGDTGVGGIATPLTAEVVGKHVLLIFCQRDITKWLLYGNENVAPETGRKYDIADCIAIEGATSFTVQRQYSTASDSLTVYYRNSKIEIKNDGSILLDNGPAKIEMKTTGDVAINGTNLVVKA